MPQEQVHKSAFAMNIRWTLTGWILNGENLCGFAWISNTSLVLGSDLELHLRPFVHIRHLELSLFVWSLAALQPASSQLLFLLNNVPAKQKVTDLLNRSSIAFGVTNSIKANQGL